MPLDHNLLDAIFIAKDIIETNQQIITTVQHDRKCLGEKKFEIADRVKTHVSVSSLIPIIKKAVRKHTGSEVIEVGIHKIDTTNAPIDPNGSRMAGILVKHDDDSFGILLNQGESYCTQRFSMCKELAQIYVDTLIDDGKVGDPNNQILEAKKELITKYYSASHSPELLESFENSEMFAQAIALELMIPYTLRDEIFASYHKDRAATAQRLFITQEVLDGYMANYYDETTPIYDMI